MTFSSLFSVILVATITVASPLKTNFKATRGGAANNIIARDRARLQAIVGPQKGSGNHFSRSTEPGASAAIVDTIFLPTVEVQVGNPPTAYQLIVDTGSSNTIIGGNKQYVSTNSSQDTGDQISLTLGGNTLSGELFNDDVTVGGLTVASQTIGVVNQSNQSQSLMGLDGILGLGPDDLTLNSIVNESGAVISTVPDNLAKQGKISSVLVGISIPLASDPQTVGSLDFGAPDPSKFIGDIVYVPVSTTSPASTFWGINQSITYGDANVQILPNTAGIISTGSTLFTLASDAFQASDDWPVKNR